MIFILRHGERADDSGYNKEIELEHDPHLTKYGKEQSIAAGRAVRKYIQESYDQGLLKIKNPKIILVSSPYLRCIETACGLKSAFEDDQIYNKTIYLDDGISEFLGEVFFDFDALKKLHVRTKTPLQFEKYINYKVQEGFIGHQIHSRVPVFPEIHKDFFARAASAYKTLVDHFLNVVNKDRDKVLILITHGFVMKVVLGVNGILESKGSDYTSITQVYYENGTDIKGKVIRSLDIQHLHELNMKPKL